MKELTDEAFLGFEDFAEENPLWTEEDEENLNELIAQKKDQTE